ncbi:MAG: aminotransferase class V-fold PLP-dependent enzyme [Oscillospiraceae bacterium]
MESIGARRRLLQRSPGADPCRAVLPRRSRAVRVLSVRHPRIGSEELGAELGRRGVCVRAGLHCAPLAHESAGTIENGTVRLSFSPFNSSADADRAAAQLRASVKSLLDD